MNNVTKNFKQEYELVRYVLGYPDANVDGGLEGSKSGFKKVTKMILTNIMVMDWT